MWHTYLQDFIHQTPACSSHLLVSHPFTLSLSLPSPTLPPLSPSLPLSLSGCACACQPVCGGESLHPVESGTGAQLQRLTSSLSERRFSPPAICTLSLALSLCLALPIFLYTLSLLTQPLTRSLCTVVSSSHLTLPPLIVSYLPLHIPTSFQAATCE